MPIWEMRLLPRSLPVLQHPCWWTGSLGVFPGVSDQQILVAKDLWEYFYPMSRSLSVLVIQVYWDVQDNWGTMLVTGVAIFQPSPWAQSSISKTDTRFSWTFSLRTVSRHDFMSLVAGVAMKRQVARLLMSLLSSMNVVIIVSGQVPKGVQSMN